MSEYIDGSPCIAVCTLDSDGYCEGCRRSREEIRVWRDLAPEARDRINRRLLEDAHPAVRFRLLGDAGGGDGKRRGGRQGRQNRTS